MSDLSLRGDSPSIAVAGDICLDVLGLPCPAPPSRGAPVDNWRQTGETRLFFLRGGAFLLEDWVRAAASWPVFGSRPCRPAALVTGGDTTGPLSASELIEVAARLTREEVVHSLLEVGEFPAAPGDKTRPVRVRRMEGFSGPRTGDPTLTMLPPETGSPPAIVVLDDTGNRFRRTPEHWPVELTEGAPAAGSLVVYKLHRPLPTPTTSGGSGSVEAAPLWTRVQERYGDRRVVIVSIDDLRDLDASISQGASWERTALELVWQLLNVQTFQELRDCPHLIIRLGLDGAVYWRRMSEGGKVRYRAWLFYDPAGIEGTGEAACSGKMVGYGSAFTAAVVAELVTACEDEKRAPAEAILDPVRPLAKCVQMGVLAGLQASRRLLQSGFSRTSTGDPHYPGTELFATRRGVSGFACAEIPIIPQSVVPDRGYWRLLDTIFEGRTDQLHAAVALTVTGAEARTEIEKQGMELLRQAPRAVFAKALRTYDRREIESYRSLYSLMRDYVQRTAPPRPLSVAVFGPPGAGKSFGVKMVAKSLGAEAGPRPIETLTFNLSQYQSPDELADVFHLVRDLSLRGRIPLVFFDEFDTSLGGTPLGWLRYFLAPMQDAEFLDHGAPHPIGQAIFVFAGGTCGTYAEFARPFLSPKSEEELREFRAVKGPDFLSRLRATLDIPGLDLDVDYDAYGPVEAFPCEAAILLRRAGILAHQLGEKAPQLRDSGGALRVSAPVLRGLLHLPRFLHGNRSFEALLDVSRLTGQDRLRPFQLPVASHVALHADPVHLGQHVSTEFPFPAVEREAIARSIYEVYATTRQTVELAGLPDQPPLLAWEDLPQAERESNFQQADDIAYKLRAAGLWFRKRLPGSEPPPERDPQLMAMLDRLAKAEHDRFVADKRRQGWIAASGLDRSCRREDLKLHNSLFPWGMLTPELREYDQTTVAAIPRHLAKADYEIIRPLP